MPKGRADRVLDVRGLRCPQPAVMASRCLSALGKGKTLLLITDDASARKAVVRMCLRAGYRLLDVKDSQGLLCFLIQK
jgi:tRNA 2-thiouridine synthesizing protein A